MFHLESHLFIFYSFHITSTVLVVSFLSVRLNSTSFLSSDQVVPAFAALLCADRAHALRIRSVLVSFFRDTQMPIE